MRTWCGGLAAVLLSVVAASADTPRIAYTLGGMPNMPDGDLIIDIVTKRLQAFGLNPTSRQRGTELRVEFDDARSPEEAELMLTRPGASSLHSGVKRVETCDGVTVKGMTCLQTADGSEFYLLKAAPDLSGEIFERAEAFEDTRGTTAINLTIGEKMQSEFSAMTQRETGNQIAIVIDDIVVSVPRIMEPLHGRSIQISGFDDHFEAWSVILSLPPLPQPLILLDVEKITQ